MTRLKEKYIKEVIPIMKQEFGYVNDFEVPRIEKVVINSGLGKGVLNPNLIPEAEEALYMITGQKPAKCLSKKAIAGFKLRAGVPIGLRITLRGDKMYEFLDKLVNIVLPRIRDFRGLSPVLDGRGNYNLGIKEHIVFPEIDYEKVKEIFGLGISISTSTKSDKEAKRLLELLGFPFITQGEV